MKTYVVHRSNADSVMVPAENIAVDVRGVLFLYRAGGDTEVTVAAFTPGDWTHVNTLPAGGAE